MINANQLSTELRMMPDQALQRMAMMYKNDPYILPMVISEDMARKKMRQAAQAQATQPQPKVADQAIAAMGTPPAPGIAALQAPNMESMTDGGIAGYAEGGVADTAEDAFSRGGMFDFTQRSEPVVRMAGGGVPGYAAGARIRDFESLIRGEAERQGIDPDLALRLFATESGGDPEAVSRKGAVGLGQLMPEAAKEMGLTLEERKDPIKNVQASVGYLKRQLDKYGSYDKALAAYNFGPGNLDKHLAKNEGQLNVIGLPKETANYLTKILPMGSAQAADQKKTALDVVSERQKAEPDQPWHKRLTEAMKSGEAQRQAMLGIADLPYAAVGSLSDIGAMALRPFGYKVEKPVMGSAWLKEKAEQLGIREPESQDQVLRGIRGGAETVATLATPLRAPAARANTAEQIARAKAADEAALAAQAKVEAPRIEGPMTPRLPAPGATAEQQQAGLAALEADRVRRAQRAQEAMRADVEAAQAAKAEAVASKVSPVEAAAKTPKVQTAVRTAEAGRLGEEAAKLVPPSVPKTPPAAVVPPDLTDKEKDKVVDAAKSAVKDPSKAEGWTNDDWLNFGFALLANRSPYFMEAVGMAGLKTLAAKQEKAKLLEESEYRKAQMAKLKAEAAYITDTKAKSELYNRATRLAQAQINALKANPQSYGLTPEQVEEQSSAIIRRIYNDLLQQEGMAGETVATAPAKGGIPSTPPPGAVKKIG